jgi:hypothetical protein
MKIAIDFDGVIVERHGIPRELGYTDCPPTKDCIDAVRWLKNQGHDLYIFTSREKEQWKDIQKWLRKNGLPRLPITNTKIHATIYLDDRAIRFTTWLDFCKLFG